VQLELVVGRTLAPAKKRELWVRRVPLPPPPPPPPATAIYCPTPGPPVPGDIGHLAVRALPRRVSGPASGGWAERAGRAQIDPEEELARALAEPLAESDEFPPMPDSDFDPQDAPPARDSGPPRDEADTMRGVSSAEA
jgi:hypothetical protein